MIPPHLAAGLRDRLPPRGDCSMDVWFVRAEGLLQDLGDFFELQAFEVSEDQGCSVARRKPRDESREIRAFARALESRMRAVGRIGMPLGRLSVQGLCDVFLSPRPVARDVQ